MSGPSIRTGSNTFMTQRYHAGQVYAPQTCSGFSDKVANLERTIKEVQQNYEEALKRAGHYDFLSTGLLVSSIVKDSCVAFLDLGASILDSVGLKQAAKTASVGVNAIQIAETSSQWAAGQISNTQAVTGLADTASNFISDDSMGQAAGKFMVQQHTGMANFVSNAQNSSKEENMRNSMKFVAGQVVSTADIVQKAAEQSKESWAGPLGKVMNGVKGLMAIENYKHSMDKTFDTALQDKEYTAGLRRNAKMQFETQMKKTQQLLKDWQAQLQICINSSEEGQGKPAPFVGFAPTPYAPTANSTPAFYTVSWPGK